MKLNQCQLLNISFCPSTEEDIPEKQSLVVVAYNPLGWSRTEVIRIPVNHSNFVIQDSEGNIIEGQYIAMDNSTINLRNFYTKAYLGVSPKQGPMYWLLFQVSVPPLGWNTYFISKMALKGESGNGYISVIESPLNEAIEVGPGNLKMSFSVMSGQLQRMFNSKTGADVPMQQSYLWYGSSQGDVDSTTGSNAYIFVPNGSIPHDVARSVPLKVIRGPLVDEVHQQFSPWIYQVTRLYKDKEHAEVEFTIGPIPSDDGIGKEVIARMTTNMATDKVFYTDSNGRDFLKRVRDYREDWNLTVAQPVAGNYYPITLGAFIMDKKSEFSVLVDCAVGGASIKDGEVELMLHRRILYDNGGPVDTLNETVCTEDKCEGLSVRGSYYMSINLLGTGALWRRTTGQEVYSPLLLAFTKENMEDWKTSHLLKATSMSSNYSLPLNVALITLQELDDGSVLLRLAHLYEAGEHAEYSTMAQVELKKIFSGKMIKEIKETNLSANQDKWEMRRLKWNVEGENGEEPSPIRGDPVSNSTLIVELGPMEIRTFLLKF